MLPIDGLAYKLQRVRREFDACTVLFVLLSMYLDTCMEHIVFTTKVMLQSGYVFMKCFSLDNSTCNSKALFELRSVDK